MGNRARQRATFAGAVRSLALPCLCGLILVARAGVVLAQDATPIEPVAARAQEAAPIEPVAATGGVLDILYLRPFTLDEPFVYTWIHGQPEITAGYLAVLEVRPDLVLPRAVDVPVLFAGDTPVHFTNTGYPSGRLIVFVPDWVDPATAPFYFGSMELPERITRSRGAAERAAAVADGAIPFADERIGQARAGGGEPARLADSVALFRAAADLIDAYAPDEAEKAEIYRTRLVGE